MTKLKLILMTVIAMACMAIPATAFATDSTGMIFYPTGDNQFAKEGTHYEVSSYEDLMVDGNVVPPEPALGTVENGEITYQGDTLLLKKDSVSQDDSIPSKDTTFMYQVAPNGQTNGFFFWKWWQYQSMWMCVEEPLTGQGGDSIYKNMRVWEEDYTLEDFQAGGDFYFYYEIEVEDYEGTFFMQSDPILVHIAEAPTPSPEEQLKEAKKQKHQELEAMLAEVDKDSYRTYDYTAIEGYVKEGHDTVSAAESIEDLDGITEDVAANIATVKTDAQRTADEEAAAEAVQEQLDELTEEYEAQIEQLNTDHEAEITELNEAHEQAIADLTAEYEGQITDIKADYDARIAQLNTDHAAEIARLEAERDARIAELKSTYDAEIENLNSAHESEVATLVAQHNAEVANLRTTYEARIAELVAENNRLLDIIENMPSGSTLNDIKNVVKHIVTFDRTLKKDSDYSAENVALLNTYKSDALTAITNAESQEEVISIYEEYATNINAVPTKAQEATEKEAARYAQMGEDGTAYGKGASYEANNAAILALTDDEDPIGSKILPLKVTSPKQGKKSITLKYTEVQGAERYVIYGSKCGTKMKQIKITANNTVTIKKLKKNSYNKFIVVALDKNNNVISTSKVVHVATKGKYKNYKKVTVSNAKSFVGMTTGKATKIKAKAVGKKVKNHAKLRYESTNEAVATVDASGYVTAVGSGDAKIIVYSQNGKSKTINISVK